MKRILVSIFYTFLASATVLSIVAIFRGILYALKTHSDTAVWVIFGIFLLEFFLFIYYLFGKYYE